MELREFAETILFGDTLAEKLVVPGGRFLDRRPAPRRPIPDAPGRIAALRFAPKEARAAFPKPHTLKRDTGRGAMLHFFANHELLALELMALALLKFPDAPAKFRLGIGYTMLEEQVHFGLYRERMEALGVGFGELGLSPFFWDALSGMRTPREYVAWMALVFEQANLDFAAHYRDLFRGLGDDVSADIMQRVYDDEIGHVKFGVSWFNTMRDSAESFWESFEGALPHPLSPTRAKGAKGVHFDVAGRRKAGLSDDFIRKLEVFSQSKGAPARVFIADDAATAYLGMFLGSRSDIVAAPPPPLDYLEPWRRLDVPIPEFVAPEELEVVLRGRRHLRDLRPFRHTARSRGLARRLGSKLTLDTTPTAALVERIEGEPFGQEFATGRSSGVVVEGATILSFCLDGGAAGKRALFTRRARLRDVDRELGGELGAVIAGRPWSGLDASIVRWVHEPAVAGEKPACSPIVQIRAWVERVRDALACAGYRGAARVDVHIGRGQQGRWRWEPGKVRLGESPDAVALALCRWTSEGQATVLVRADGRLANERLDSLLVSGPAEIVIRKQRPVLASGGVRVTPRPVGGEASGFAVFAGWPEVAQTIVRARKY